MPPCVNESTTIEIRFKPEADTVSADEIALLESILPELIHAMIQAQALDDAA